ncbi:hypothetical protein BH11ARM2_BH11ARM2_24940 [soil metagenome]
MEARAKDAGATISHDAPFADRLFAALEDGFAYARGELDLKVTYVAVPELPRYGAKELTEVRTRLGMSPYGFADLLGVSAATLQRWENGESKPPRTVRRLLQMLDHPQELIAITERRAA